MSIDNHDEHVRGQGQKSKVKATEVKANFAPIWFLSGPELQFEFTDGYEMKHIAWSSIEKVSYLFFKVICHISRSQGTRNHRIWPKLGVPGL